jgi:carbonic anhydrase/acetyltransferase-like protein (isoleucine patch superfamily)
MTFTLGLAQASILPYDDIWPGIHPTVLICDGVRLIGDIEIGPNSSIWFNTVIRADVFPIRIGAMTNIQDGSILHVTTDTYALNIGDQVTVGHGAILHGATIQSRCLIGMGAKVLDNALIGEGSIVAAGAVVREGMQVPPGVLVAGVPARIIRDIPAGEAVRFTDSALHYAEIAAKYRAYYKQNPL